MKIGELARRSGVSASALRFYEKLGVLPAPTRASGRRLYGQDALDGIRFVRALQRSGFTLAEIRRLLVRPAAERRPAGWREEARAKLSEFDARIAQLVSARAVLAGSLDCACRGRADACSLVLDTDALAPVRQRRRPTGSSER